MNYTIQIRVLVLLALLHIGTPVAANPVDVRYENGLLSVEANNSSLLDIMTELQRLTGTLITSTDGMDKRITLSLVNETLESIIPKLATNVMVKRNAQHSIVEYVLLLDNEGGSLADANLPSGEPVSDVVMEVDQQSITDENTAQPSYNSDGVEIVVEETPLVPR